MRRRTVRHALPALVALLLFGIWVGAAILHEHPGAPCQICRDLQASQVDVASPVEPPRVEAPPERLAESEPSTLVALLLTVPEGRGPPQA